ncbi:phytase, partial [Apiospora sp. TS-2023a]
TLEIGTLNQAASAKRNWIGGHVSFVEHRKHIGYKGFAEYSSLADEYFVLRRYDELHCRVLFTLQQRIAVLEDDLKQLDETLRRRTPDVDNGTVRKDQPDRQRLVEEIARELKTYADMVLSYRELKSLPTAPKRNVKNINTWLYNTNFPIEKKEVEFLEARDLVSVTPSRKSFLRKLFEKFVLMPTRGLFGLLGSRDGPDGTNIHGSDEPVDTMAAVTIFVVGIILLIAPLWILANTHDMNKRLGIITTFIAVLLAVLTSATLGKPFEILAATAGYSAVLVVFLQIGNAGG